MNVRTDRRRTGRTGGFTLVELLVVLSIMVIITLITTFGKTQFERSIVLTNLAYDISIAVRETQVYGTNVRQTTIPAGCSGSALATNAYDVGYGVHFSTASSTSFVEFSDPDNTHSYDGGNGVVCDQVVQNYVIKNNNIVSALCVVPAGITTCTSVTSLDVTFRRPDPDACFTINGAVVRSKTTADCVQSSNYGEARITIKAPDNTLRVIHISTTGWISVQNS